MKKLVVGILAHVDAGKTTLSEAMLYLSGALRKLGRVDHGDAFLDTDAQERERGITIFSKQAMLTLESTEISLLDTPGHVDFSAEMERTLGVLDCAILVISGTDGVQGHTRTLWRLLERYNVPTFIFANKMDLDGADRASLMENFRRRLGDGCVDFSGISEGDASAVHEAAAMTDETALEEFLESGALSDARLASLIAERKVFPCCFGSALKVEGVGEFLATLEKYAPSPAYPEEFGAKVFKVSRDAKGARLTWVKVTGGVLRAKALLDGTLTASGTDGDERWEEKADQLRRYSGAKFITVESASAGEVVALTGLTRTYPGEGLGAEADTPKAMLEPVLGYRMILPEGTDPHSVLPKLRQLEDEDPMLRIIWNEQWGEINVRLMGQVQLEVLERVISERFGLAVSFDRGSIVYKETIASTVEGVGHFEPLRHYAEVHLILEPGERGSGVRLETAVSVNDLDINWQRLIFTHLLERDHPGVLTGSPLTDVKITLTAGRDHLKHTEGGDFRQATYRAVRQGLMQAESVLLEPFYDFRFELPANCVGRAMTDVQAMGGTLNDPEIDGELTILTGYAPVAGLQNYREELNAYTRGIGQMSVTLRGYERCHNADEVIAEIGYEAEHDTENPADSVFCAHGTGFVVKWNDVQNYMHLESTLKPKKVEEVEVSTRGGERRYHATSFEQDKELRGIFERTYGKVEHRSFEPTKRSAASSIDDYVYRQRNVRKDGPEYLLVDGYNIIFAWEELRELARVDIGAAREALEEILINYRAFRKCVVILVFDAYKVKGGVGSVMKKNGIDIVFTKEAETADTYIEKATYVLGRDHKVRVATSDGLEQVIILGHGALRLSAETFRTEVDAAQVRISELIREHNASANRATRVKHETKPLK